MKITVNFMIFWFVDKWEVGSGKLLYFGTSNLL